MRSFVLAVVLALLSAGCVSVSVAPDPLKAPPKANESAVVISVTGNTAQVTAFDTLSVRWIQPPDKGVEVSHVLTQVVPGLSRDTALFIGVLPEGEYEFTSFRDADTQRLLNLNDGMRRRLGRFTVREGKPVDLGRLVMTPVNTRVVIGRSARIASNVPLMRRFAPEHARLFAGEAGGWSTPRAEDDRVEEYALQRPVGASYPTELPDRTVIAASRLGTVLIRSPEGRWRAVRSEGLDSLLCAVPVERPDASLVAVGEFGTLLRLPPLGGRLVPMDTGDLPPGNLLFIDGNDRSGWYLAHKSGTEVTLFRSAKLDGGQWRPLRKESVAAEFWSGANSFWIWRTPRGLGYAVSQGVVHLLDYASGTWVAHKTPNDHRLTSIAADPGGALGILTSPGGGFGGIFAGMYLSKDEGRSWQEVSSEFKVKIAPPRRTPAGTLLLAGGVFSNPELHASKDEGKSWQKVGDFPRDRSLTVLPSGALLSVDDGQFGLFSIRYSTDEGATWRSEYSNFDRRAYEADEQRRKQ